MRYVFLAAFIVCGGASVAVQAVESVAGHTPTDRLAGPSDPVDFDAWEVTLTADERERLNQHFLRHNGVTNYPTMTANVMGIAYAPIRSLPLDTFHHELSGYAASQTNQRLIEIFNIQLISSQRDIDYPISATLHVELSKNGRYVHIEAPMDLRGDAYYPSQPTTLLSELIEAVSDLGRYPTMLFSKFEGFVLNSDTIEDLPPLGIPVVYNFRFGDVRVDTGFQWIGRPKGPINAGVEFLK